MICNFNLHYLQCATNKGKIDDSHCYYYTNVEPMWANENCFYTLVY